MKSRSPGSQLIYHIHKLSGAGSRQHHTPLDDTRCMSYPVIAGCPSNQETLFSVFPHIAQELVKDRETVFGIAIGYEVSAMVVPLPH